MLFLQVWTFKAAFEKWGILGAYSRTQIHSQLSSLEAKGWVLDVSDFRVQGLVLKTLVLNLDAKIFLRIYKKNVVLNVIIIFIDYNLIDICNKYMSVDIWRCYFYGNLFTFSFNTMWAQ